MKTKAVAPKSSVIPVSRKDLIAAWSVLEKVVVSLRKIGSAFAVPEGQADQTPEQRQVELKALDDFISPQVLRELSHARRLLAEYLPSEEIERLSENSIEFWSPSDTKSLKH
jgi:hypothetical protein